MKPTKYTRKVNAVLGGKLIPMVQRLWVNPDNTKEANWKNEKLLT